MGEIVRLFLKLGCLGFGGPIATMAMMEAEAVQRLSWLTPAKFSQVYALLKVLPGPTATQMAIYLGKLRGGRLGGLISGILFILPAFVLVLIISIFYNKFHGVPHAEDLFQGMQVAALVVIADSVIRMAKPYSRDSQAIVIAVLAGTAIFVKPSYEPLVILVFGLGMVFLGPKLHSFFILPAGLIEVLRLPTGDSGDSSLLKLIWVCFKAGAFVFGTGLAIVPMIEADVVTKFHWLTHSEFLDGLAIGQITPGPVVITSTFIGFQLAGLIGALLATVAVFLPAFINILFIVPALEGALQKSPQPSQKLEKFSHGAFPAVIGGIIATTLRLAVFSLSSTALAVVLVVCSVIVWRLRPPHWLVIPATGIIYFIFNSF